MFNWLKKSSSYIEKQAEKATCPYCSHELEKFPARKQKCPSCGKEFVVRTHYLSKQKMVLTDKDAVKYDAEKEKYYTDKSLIDGLKLNINVDKNAVDRLVEKTREELTKKFGQPAALGDVAWGVANRMIADAARKGDLGLINMIQFQMALYLHNSGKDCNHIRVASFDTELQNYKKSRVTAGVGISAANCCEQCKHLDGQTYMLDEVIKQKVLPCRECTNKLNPKAPTGWCVCCYIPLIDMKS